MREEGCPLLGRILIAVLLVLLALILALLFLPVTARVAYNRGAVSAWVRFGPVKLTLYPPKKTQREKPAKVKKAKSGEEAADRPEKEKKHRLNREQLLYSIDVLPPILGRALRRTRWRVRLEPLKVHLLIAGDDPADTAQLYGRLKGALAAGLPALHRLVRIKDQDIRLFLDFQGTEMDCIADAGLTIRPWDVLVIGLCAGGSLLKWLMGMRKLATPEKTPDKAVNNRQKTDTKDNDRTSGAA